MDLKLTLSKSEKLNTETQLSTPNSWSEMKVIKSNKSNKSNMQPSNQSNERRAGPAKGAVWTVIKVIKNNKKVTLEGVLLVTF